MSIDTSRPPLEPDKATPPRSRWQFSLRMILLLMAAVGVWTAEISNRYTIAHLEKRIAATRPLARELIIKDKDKIAIVKLDEEWYDANEWRVYLPAGEYNLCMATQEIPAKDFPPEKMQIPLASGEFELSLLQRKDAEGYHVQILLNGQSVITAREPLTWQPGGGSSGGGQFSSSEQFVPTEPVVLFRRRFHQPVGPNSNAAPDGPCTGLMLWIEPVERK
jgi:hypothetical protein